MDMSSSSLQLPTQAYYDDPDYFEVMANTPLAKPNNFEEARETESKCVKFAKEVWWHWLYDDDDDDD